MPIENPKTAPSTWTTISVKGPTADAVIGLQDSYRRKHGKSISQDLLVATAVERLKVADLPPPTKRAARKP